MKIKIKEPNDYSVIKFKDLKVGEFAVITDTACNRDYENKIVVKTYDNVTALDDPGCTWILDSKMECRRLPKGTEITIVI